MSTYDSPLFGLVKRGCISKSDRCKSRGTPSLIASIYGEGVCRTIARRVEKGSSPDLDSFTGERINAFVLSPTLHARGDPGSRSICGHGYSESAADPDSL